MLVFLLSASLLVAACSAGGRRALALSSVPEVEPERAAEFTGRPVRIRGTVVAAEASSGRALLDVAARGGAPLRVVIAPPLLGLQPAEIVARLRGREVVAEGQIEDFGARIEMLVGDPEAVRIVSEGADPAVMASAPPAVVSGGAESRPQPEPPTREPAREPVPHLTRDAGTDAAAACERARESWRRASEAARAPLTELQRCLREGRPPCHREGLAVREVLAELAAAEERMAWLCPGER